MKSSDCEKIQNLIPLYLDNMLSDEEKDVVDAHIADCETCREELFFMQSVLEHTKDLPEVEVSEGFHSRVMAQVKKETAMPKKRYAFSWKQASSFVAAAAVVALSVVSFLSLEEPSDIQNTDVYITVPSAQPEVEAVQGTEEKQPALEPQTQGTKKPAARKNIVTQEPSFAPADTATGYEPDNISVARSVEDVPSAYTVQEADVCCSLVTVTVSETAKADAEVILQAYPKDEIGYQVGENLDLVLTKLATLDGYTCTEEVVEDIEQNYILLP